jgi:outer membrane protein TolC
MKWVLAALPTRVPQVAVLRDLCALLVRQAQVCDYADLWHPRALLVLAALLTIGGCTTQWAKDDADKQVYSILAERKDQTLHYQPQAVAATTVTQQEPTHKSYMKVPVTPTPPRQTSPMEPMRTMLPFCRLSPTPEESRRPLPISPELAATRPTVQSNVFGVEAAEERATKLLRLGPPGRESEPVRLGLFDSIRYAVQHGRDYQTEMETLYLAALDVTLQRHLFEPQPFATMNGQFNGFRNLEYDPRYQAAITATGSAGFKQQLPYGGQIVAQTLVSFVDTLSGQLENGQAAELALSGSIPLLRGAGMINLEPLIASERTLIYQVRGFETFRRAYALNVATQYFGLIAAQKGVINRRVNYSNLLILTEQTQALYGAGRINFLGVQRALQAQLFAESDLVSAQEAYQAALDQFKQQLGMPIDENLDAAPEELDVASPDLTNISSEDLAMRYRLDLKTAEDQIDDARRQVGIAKNGLLPDANLNFNVGLGNDPSLPEIRPDYSAKSYGGGITIDLPVDRLAERNQYRRSLIFLEQADRNYQNQRDQVIVDVRSAVRTIFSATTALAIQRRNIDLAQRRLEYSYELLKLGAADSRDVVEAQQSLLSAEDSYEVALSNYQVAVLRYLNSTGTLRLDPEAGTLGYAMDREAGAGHDKGNTAVRTEYELDNAKKLP